MARCEIKAVEDVRSVDRGKTKVEGEPMGMRLRRSELGQNIEENDHLLEGVRQAVRQQRCVDVGYVGVPFVSLSD